MIYSGRDDGMHRNGVAIMMSKLAESALLEWLPINNRIIKACFHSKFIKLTVIHVYVPTMDAEEDDKDQFYDQLLSVPEKVNKHDLLLITGDMNSKVGSSNQDSERVMGKHGTGTINSNGERLIELCEMNNLGPVVRNPD